MIGQSATGQGHEIFNLSEKELVYKQKVSSHLALCQMIGQSATGQGHEIFNLSEKELVYKQKVSSQQGLSYMDPELL